MSLASNEISQAVEITAYNIMAVMGKKLLDRPIISHNFIASTPCLARISLGQASRVVCTFKVTFLYVYSRSTATDILISLGLCNDIFVF